MKKKMIIMLVGVTLLFGLIFIVHTIRKVFIAQYIHTMTTQAITISTAEVKETSWHSQLEAIGTLTAVNSVNVSSEVNGMIMAIHFTSGQIVNKGDPLIQLDDSIDQQTLNTNSAQLNLDKLNYERQVELLKTHSASQSDVDQSYAKMLQSQAAVATAQVYIDKKKIKAPFAGKLGINQVNLGQYLSPGQAIVLLTALDPLYVDFSLPEQNYPSLHMNQPIKFSIDAYRSKEFDGQIMAIDSSVDVNTRSLNIRAITSNKNLQLYPGMFAQVHVILPTEQNKLVIPETAVNYSLHGDTAYVVEQAGKDKDGQPILKAVPRFIVTGEKRSNQVIVLKGLKAGEQVVTSGQLKLEPNALVKINNSIKLD